MKRLLICIALALISVGCTTHNAATPKASHTASAIPKASPSPTQPLTLMAAKSTIHTYFERASAGDFSGNWLMFIPADKQLISQKEYAKYQKKCHADSFALFSTADFKVTDAYFANATTVKAVVKVKDIFAPVRETVHVYYVSGQWMFKMTKQNHHEAQYWVTHHKCVKRTGPPLN